MRIKPLRLAMVAALGLATAAPVHAAGITVFKDGDKYVKMGGRIQMQYYRLDPDNGSSTDDLFFRRLRPYIEGSLHKDWKGKFQFDYGKAEDDNEVAVKDAYMQYSGFENTKVTVGNANFPFSREFLTSSKKQQFVERTFVGDHNYGTPDRNLGIHLTGHNGSKNLTWGASVAQADIDPNAGRIDFDTPVNADSDFNQGIIYGGRLDFHPFGELKFEQGDFSGDTKATIGVAAFMWSNDGDNEANAASLDEVTGYEISAAFRSSGFSVDAQYNLFQADTTDSAFTGGLYENGETDLENWSIEGGYMIVGDRLELVAGYSQQDADNYGEEWARTTFGANWFIHKHDIKVQATYQLNDSVAGVNGNDADEMFVQAQYVF
ncbi:MAG: hypothetical protein J5I92_00785 [Thiogranum sp.]|nr:hypothetical protein [Thiogranum sp.]